INDGVRFDDTIVPFEVDLDAAITVEGGEDDLKLAGVDPVNPDVVYLETQSRTGTGPTRLLVTKDGGKKVTVAQAFGGEVAAFAPPADGTKVYVGSRQDGLFVANASDLAFRKVSAIGIQCLAKVGSTLYACAGETSGFVLGASEDEGASFVPVLHLCGFR